MSMVKRQGKAFARYLQNPHLRLGYRSYQMNCCPTCSESQWLVGRSTAECAFCSTSLPLERSFTPTRLKTSGRGA